MCECNHICVHAGICNLQSPRGSLYPQRVAGIGSMESKATEAFLFGLQLQRGKCGCSFNIINFPFSASSLFCLFHEDPDSISCGQLTFLFRSEIKPLIQRLIFTVGVWKTDFSFSLCYPKQPVPHKVIKHSDIYQSTHFMSWQLMDMTSLQSHPSSFHQIFTSIPLPQGL